MFGLLFCRFQVTLPQWQQKCINAAKLQSCTLLWQRTDISFALVIS